MIRFTKYLAQCLNVVFRKKNDDDHEWRDYDFVDIGNDHTLLHECFIASSHNSVIGDLQILGPAKIKYLKEALNLKMRMVELDVYVDHNDSNKPVVSHGNLKDNLQVTSCVDFEECCKVIREYAWKCTNEPFFMILELNLYSGDVIHTVRQMLIHYFKTRILIPNANKKLHEYELKELKNKIVILPLIRNNALKDIAYTTMYNRNEMLHLPHTIPLSKIPLRNKRMISIYPSTKILSKNYDYSQFVGLGHFVAMNITYKDEHFEKYIKNFKNRGIIPFCEIDPKK